MIKVKITCVHCKKYFFREQRRVNENNKLRSSSYCSKACQYAHQTLARQFICENLACGKKFLRHPAAISSSNYCSRSCAVQINNKRFPKRIAPLKVCANEQCGKEFKGEALHCSDACWAIVRQKHTKEDLIHTIQMVAKRLQRVPVKRELVDIAEACKYAFGSWNNAVVAAGFLPNRSDDARMYKRMRTFARDGHLCDSVSEAIIDDWLTSHHITHEHHVGYPHGNYKADWRLRDGTFVEYFGLAKDSPRYDRTIKEKENLCRELNLALIAVYPTDLYPRNRLAGKFAMMQQTAKVK